MAESCPSPVKQRAPEPAQNPFHIHINLAASMASLDLTKTSSPPLKQRSYTARDGNQSYNSQVQSKTKYLTNLIVARPPLQPKPITGRLSNGYERKNTSAVLQRVSLNGKKVSGSSSRGNIVPFLKEGQPTLKPPATDFYAR